MSPIVALVLYPSKAGVVLFLSFLVILSALTLRADTTTADKIDSGIAWFVRDAPRHPMSNDERRGEVSGFLSESARRYGLPWEVLTAMAICETSVRYGRTGPAGEIGLLQVHPATASHHKCDTTTPRSRIDCGAKILKKLSDKCGSITGGVTRYSSKHGVCSAKPGSKLGRAVRRRLRIAAKLKGLQDDI